MFLLPFISFQFTKLITSMELNNKIKSMLTGNILTEYLTVSSEQLILSLLAAFYLWLFK